VTPWRWAALLLFLVAWFTAAGTAVRTVSRIWLRHWVESRLKAGASGYVYIERPQRLLAAAGAGVSLAVFLGGMLLGRAGVSVGPRFPLLVLGAGMVVLLAGQVVPRAVARRWAQRLVPVLLPALRVVDLLMAPFAAVARRVTRAVMPDAARESEEAPRDGIRDQLREGELEGVGEREEMAIISGVVDFAGKTAADVMTPRAEMFAVPVDLPPGETARQVAAAGYSRVPVYRGTLDDVLGMVHVFDLLKIDGHQAPALRPVAATRAGKPCNELLAEMLRVRRHLAIVRDDAGHTLGVVSLEDLLEELVGDIRDEHDEPGPAPLDPFAEPAAAPSAEPSALSPDRPRSTPP
jgi:putative hemolysin